jgi:hypothetical protein
MMEGTKGGSMQERVAGGITRPGVILLGSALRADPLVLLSVTPRRNAIAGGLFRGVMTEKDPPDSLRRDRQRIYEDLIRTGKQELEYQIRILLDRFDRTDRLIRLAVAILAGMIVVIGYLVAHGPQTRLLGAAAMGLSILVVMMSVYMLLRLNTSLHREGSLDLGPDTREILALVEAKNPTEEHYLVSMAERLPDHIDSNAEVVRSMSAFQGRAISVMVMGVIIHLGAIVFILGGHIHG